MSKVKKHSKVDFTAWFVLQGLVAATHVLDFVDCNTEKTLHLQKILAKHTSKQRFVSRLVHSLPYLWQYRISCFATDFSRLRHFLLRKKAIRQLVSDTLETGKIKQMVVLGSGLDVLPISIACNYPNVHFIELDLEVMQTTKLSIFTENNIIIPDNLEMLSGDLREPLSELLRSSKFQSRLPTLWLAEGLLMFLPESSVHSLFQSIRSLSTTASQLIFTSLNNDNNISKGNYWIQNMWLKKEHNPFKWYIKPDSIPDFLSKLDYKTLQIITYKNLHQSFASDGFVPRLQENIAIGEI